MTETESFDVSITYMSPNNYVDIYFAGSASPEKIKQVYQQAAKLASEHNVTNVLFDARNISLPYDVEKLYKVVEFIAQHVGHLRIARIASLNDFKQDLIEDIAIEKNLALRNFESKTLALKWLSTAELPA
ncbi:hypothetical protein QX776_02225 [Alteromonadaceae bacterium BrNp21-10]|nr:hypothetical protein [Alteromonadaceae bacterium BrNp21-10]